MTTRRSRTPVYAGLVVALVVAASFVSAARPSATALRASLSLTPNVALTGEAVFASLSGSTVPQGTTLRKITISWGDGSPPASVRSLAASPMHRFAHAGHFTVKATITDSQGMSETTSRPLRVVVQNVYWDLFYNGSPSYQLDYTKLPLTPKSTDTSISGSVGNGLRCTSGMAVDTKSRLWVISYPGGCSAPDAAEIRVFQLPLSPSSTPLFVLTLPGAGDDDSLTFDHKGNAWVADDYNKKVYEFPAPFTDNTTLVPSLTLSLPNMTPSGLAFDSHGDLFVSNVASTSTRSIAMYNVPILDTSVPKFLNGLTAPGGLTFDKHGNLYASNNPSGGQGAAIVRYDAHHLKPGAKPTVVNRAGLKGEPYEANFAWDASGNLYVADCGSVANVRVYPLAMRPFTSKLAPSVIHRDPAFNDVECAWGLAVG